MKKEISKISLVYELFFVSRMILIVFGLFGIYFLGVSKQINFNYVVYAATTQTNSELFDIRFQNISENQKIKIGDKYKINLEQRIKENNQWTDNWGEVKEDNVEWAISYDSGAVKDLKTYKNQPATFTFEAIEGYKTIRIWATLKLSFLNGPISTETIYHDFDLTNQDVVIKPASIDFVYYEGNGVVPDENELEFNESLLISVVVSPREATKGVDFFINDKSMAIITKNEGDQGTFYLIKTLQKKGDVLITAKSKVDSTIKKSIKITVKEGSSDTSSENESSSQGTNGLHIQGSGDTSSENESSSQGTNGLYIPDYPEDVFINNNGVLKNKELTIGGIFSKLLEYVYVIAGLFLLVVLIMGGLELMTAAGNPDKIKMGYGRITNALIGFLIIFISYFLVQLLEVIFGVAII